MISNSQYEFRRVATEQKHEQQSLTYEGQQRKRREPEARYRDEAKARLAADTTRMIFLRGKKMLEKER